MIRKPREIDFNVFKELNESWGLLTAGNEENLNCMTVSWGGFGILWNKPVGILYVRPTRFTYEFMEKFDTFTLSFFTEDYKDALKICGSVSGRDEDKFKLSNLTPIYDIDRNLCYPKESRIVFKFKKLYFQDIDNKNFLNPDIEKLYPNKDYHRFYIGEITQVLEIEG